MADKTTSAENAAGAITDADLFRGVQSSLNVKFTYTQVKTWIKSWIAKADIGLGNVDNTSDANKPVSTAQAASIATKQALDAQLFSNIPQNSKSAAYTTVVTDAQKHIFHPSADVTARIWTIDSNANVPYPIGTAITFVNQNGAGGISIAITADTMRWAGTGTTGSRTLAANGIATALKVTATEWLISGTGLS